MAGFKLGPDRSCWFMLDVTCAVQPSALFLRTASCLITAPHYRCGAADGESEKGSWPRSSAGVIHVCKREEEKKKSHQTRIIIVFIFIWFFFLLTWVYSHFPEWLCWFQFSFHCLSLLLGVEHRCGSLSWWPLCQKATARGLGLIPSAT